MYEGKDAWNEEQVACKAILVPSIFFFFFFFFKREMFKGKIALTAIYFRNNLSVENSY